MNEHGLTAMISQTSQLMEQFERRCTQIDQQLHKTRNALDALTLEVPAVVKVAAYESLRDMPQQVLSSVHKGLDHAVKEYTNSMSSASRSVDQGAQSLAHQLGSMERLQRLLLWKVSGVVGGSMLLLVVAAIWLSSHYMTVIRQNQVAAELLKAYNAADVVLCPDGSLCANVNGKAGKFGERGKYQMVRPR